MGANEDPFRVVLSLRGLREPIRVKMLGFTVDLPWWFCDGGVSDKV